MDAAKIIPVLIIAGCVAWYAYDRHEKKQLEAKGLILSESELNCDAIRQSLTRFDGTTPKPEERVEQACRLHVCDMSFMHGRNILFKKPYGGLRLEINGNIRTLKQSFNILENNGKLPYSFTCTVNSKDIERPGQIPVASASVVQEQ